MEVVAIIQARCSSSRLPGKVLMDILGRPMLERQIERLSYAENIDCLVVATSDHQGDDAIELLCKNIGINCYRGSLDDVLERIYNCAIEYSPKHVVRLTGDCPLIDSANLDDVVRFHLDGGYDYTSNVLEPTWPDGMDVEVMRVEVLAQAVQNATLASEREHVTTYIYNNSKNYLLGNVTSKNDLSSFRLTVDELQDLELIRKVYEILHPQNPSFSLGDVLDLLEKNPYLMELNNKFKRNEGLQRSMEKDKGIFPR